MTTMIAYGVPIVLPDIETTDIESPTTDTFYLSESSSNEYAETEKPLTLITAYYRELHTFNYYLVLTHSMMFGPRLPRFFTERVSTKIPAEMDNELTARANEIYASKNAGCLIGYRDLYWMIIESDD